MAVHTYEGMFILDSNRYSRDAAGVAGQINKMIEKCGGDILVSRLWEDRRLAYPIKGSRKGTYWLTYFKADSQQIAKLNRESRLSDPIMRAMIIKQDPRIADVAVQQYLGQAAQQKEKAAAKATDGGEAKAAGGSEAKAAGGSEAKAAGGSEAKATDGGEAKAAGGDKAKSPEPAKGEGSESSPAAD